MFLAPLHQIYLAYATRNLKYIDYTINVAILFSSLIWIWYGYLIGNNFNIIIPNTIGFTVAFLQMFIWMKLKSEEETYKQLPVSEDGVFLEDNKNNEINTNINTDLKEINTNNDIQGLEGIEEKEKDYIDIDDGMLTGDYQIK